MVVYAGNLFSLQLSLPPPLRLHRRPHTPASHLVMADENVPPPPRGQKCPHEDSALTLPSRKKVGPPNHWNLKGRHVGRTIHTFINIGQLILAGIQLDKDLSLLPANEIEKYPAQYYQIYGELLRFLPDLEEGLMKATIDTDRLHMIAARMQHGVGAARSDDVKGVEAAIVHWLADPEKGLVPPVAPNNMANRGFRHEVTGKELCPAGLDWEDPNIKSSLKAGTMAVHSDQWPIFLYMNGFYDPERPWLGFLCGRLLVNVVLYDLTDCHGVFTSPSSVNDSGRSTKSSNAAIHGMIKVTVASITYIATIVRFALGSRATFTRRDTMTDSRVFYNVLWAFLNHPNERENVNELLAWWNEQVFPYALASSRAPMGNTALAKLLEAQQTRVALPAIGANFHDIAIFRELTANSALAKLLECQVKRMVLLTISANISG
ncbi:hypothetical protein V8D89_012106 [Ganoderma adspersum]